ncbi:hypothetical protein GCM10010206_66130 [Streptomyces cinerochromogenes]|nr:hypothetical protein GCM10010206_66130 [Streptomyces cinerochromogenes]
MPVTERPPGERMQISPAWPWPQRPVLATRPRRRAHHRKSTASGRGQGFGCRSGCGATVFSMQCVCFDPDSIYVTGPGAYVPGLEDIRTAVSPT